MKEKIEDRLEYHDAKMKEAEAEIAELKARLHKKTAPEKSLAFLGRIDIKDAEEILSKIWDRFADREYHRGAWVHLKALIEE